jgi:signal transduction histidine kinase
MTYRTFKRLLGETSLERKCRFLFGGGLMLLITASFYFHGQRTERLVYEQKRVTGRMLIDSIIRDKHLRYSLPGDDEQVSGLLKTIDAMSADLKPEDLKDQSWDLISANSEAPEKRGSDPMDFDALRRINQGEREITVPDVEHRAYRFYGGVYNSKSCMGCHCNDCGGSQLHAAENDLLGMVKVTFPLASTERALAKNNAILLSTAIVTAVLAMLAAYAIVRYVIVKPVLHLKDVSDSIARGNLDLRADIRTGDEFEQLSQAFNRMLRHLVAVQEELRQVNATLDSKVDELAQANMSLYELNNLKNDFLATITHELRTPLNSILGFSEVLGSAENLNDKQQRYLRNIQTSGKDLLVLINDILDLAKIESGKMEVNVSDFSIDDLIERLVSMVRPLAEKKNIELTCFTDPELPILSQDAGKLQQIVYNLISNAIKFTPEGGRAHVAVNLKDGDTLELKIEDTGVGIPLEEQETIFEKFRQGNTAPAGKQSSLTREYAGTGLGLSIVKELSKLLGGEVAVESELGKGSSFTVCLPVHLDPPPRSITAAIPTTVELSQLRHREAALAGIAGTNSIKTG